MRARGYPFVVAVGGVSNIGKAPLPGVVQSVVIGRDGDDPGSPSDVALYCGAARRLGQGFKTTITARPNDITPKDAPPCKDLDDLYRYDPELRVRLAQWRQPRARAARGGCGRGHLCGGA